MKWALFLLFTAVISVLLWLWQVDHHTTQTAYLRLKNALDLATHDAALHIDKAELSLYGRIRFTDQAPVVLATSLQRNLRLNTANFPLSPNMFRSTDQLQLLVMESLETGCSDAAPGFPCTYRNATYDYVDTIKGPSIVSIISLRHPRPFSFSTDASFIVGSSHEYKGY